MIKQISSLKAWEILEKVHNSFLIDVRNPEEWNEVGIPDLSKINKKVVLVSWKSTSFLQVNLAFFEDIKKNVPELSKKHTLIFICKSGYRSFLASSQMFTQGFINCYNVEDGFLGNVNYTKSGWKYSNLPWH